MAALSSKLRSVRGAAGKAIGYFCPGCKSAHVLPIEGPGHPVWTWNGSVDNPTLTPSILATTPFPPEDGGPHVCHHFLREGRLEFLQDSTHDLAGKTVDLPDWPGSYSDGDRSQ